MPPANKKPVSTGTPLDPKLLAPKAAQPWEYNGKKPAHGPTKSQIKGGVPNHQRKGLTGR
jgi:hypothetical protein